MHVYPNTSLITVKTGQGFQSWAKNKVQQEIWLHSTFHSSGEYKYCIYKMSFVQEIEMIPNSRGKCSGNLFKFVHGTRKPSDNNPLHILSASWNKWQNQVTNDNKAILGLFWLWLALMSDSYQARLSGSLCKLFIQYFQPLFNLGLGYLGCSV